MIASAFWINSETTSSWGSAVLLSDFNKIRYSKIFDLASGSLQEALKTQGVEYYIFGDIHYSGQELLQGMTRLPKSAKCFFHLYGDIFSRLKFFEKNRETFKSYQLRFVLGSESSYRIAKNCFQDERNISYKPFCVQEHTRSVKLKSMTSKKRKILYAGRISYFKNVHQLIKLFDLFTDSETNYELHIAGTPDNVRWRNNPTSSYFNYSGEIFNLALQEVQSKGKAVIYHGQLPHDKLIDLMSGVDTFTTLSTGEEEDFGMAIFEALNENLNVVATKWGGHRQFENLNGVHLIDVHVEGGNLKIIPDDLFKAWKDSLKNSQSLQVRNRLWMQPEPDTESWSSLGVFSEKFSKLQASTSFNKEFYEHGKDILYPLWD